MSTRGEPAAPVRLRTYALEAAATKFLRLGVEIEAFTRGTERGALLETHDALDHFLGNAIGKPWHDAKREARGEGDWPYEPRTTE